MAGMTDLAIRIATTYDSAGLNKADKGVKKLESTVKSLGRTLGLTLGAAAMTAYGKAAVKAFASDEAAARRLAGAVDNLGLSFSQAKVTDFIAQLEQSAAIADDVLRPAFQSLLTTTGSLTKSQELLNNAIQISRASGIDLATVATDLGKGYVGITRGLVKYNTGLTRAEITTKSFNEILGVMLARSAGAAQDYLTTTSYKMEVLTVAAGNAQETIGMGLVDAFAKLGGGSSASDAAKTINDIAKGINAVTNAAATAVGAVVKLYKGLDYLTSFGGRTGANGSIAQYADSVENRLRQFDNPRSKSPAGTAQRTAQQRQAEATAAKRAKELAALQTKQVKSQKALTEEQKKQNALKKAGTIFDLEQIQLIAALQGNLSKEEKTRLEAQLALLNNNEQVASSLTKQILMSQDATGQLYKLWLTLPDARNPFKYLEGYLETLAGKASAVLSVTGSSGVVYNSAAAANRYSDTTGPILPSTNVAAMPAPSYNSAAAANRYSDTTGPIQVSVNIDGKQIASSLQDTSLSGISSSVNRTYGSFAGR
jgi:hypothetical protein